MCITVVLLSKCTGDDDVLIGRIEKKIIYIYIYVCIYIYISATF